MAVHGLRYSYPSDQVQLRYISRHLDDFFFATGELLAWQESNMAQNFLQNM